MKQSEITSEVFVKKIKPNETIDIPKRSKPKIKGSRTKLGLKVFFWNCLKVNEELDSLSFRMTNPELFRQVSIEYKSFPKTIQAIKENRPGINDYRHRYNKGNLCYIGYAPLLSFRWNKINEIYLPVDTRTGHKVLSYKQIYDYWNRYHKYGGLKESFDVMVIRITKIVCKQDDYYEGRENVSWPSLLSNLSDRNNIKVG